MKLIYVSDDGLSKELQAVVRKYPEFKDDIDFILRSEGYGELIVVE